MRAVWILYQCPGDPHKALHLHVQNVVGVLLTQLYHQVTAEDVEVGNCWTWSAGDGHDNRRRLHMAYGKVEVRELWESISLVVVPDGEVQPFGIVLLDPAVWQLARIQRQLWRVDGRELDFYSAVASRGIEDRGRPLETIASALPFLD